MKHKDTTTPGKAAVLCVFLSLCLASFVNAEIIDGIVAIVEGHIITISDMRQEREIRARLGEKAINDDKALVREMIDDLLIKSQMADFPGVEVTEADVDGEIQKSQGRYGEATKAIRDAIRTRMQMSRYFDVRFRQFLRASDDEALKYYDDVFVPEARARQIPIPGFDQVQAAIRNNIIEEKLKHEVDSWLEAIRRRSSIEIF